jgi:PAS domain S-box-containing protein
LMKTLSIGFETYESSGAVASVQGLKGDFILGAILIVVLILMGIVLIVFLVLEISARLKLIEEMRASREQARAAREREEQALIESGRRFLAIARANPVALLVAGAEGGVIRYANPAAMALFGFFDEVPPGSRIADFFVRDRDLQAVVEAGKRGTADRHETMLRRRDGSEAPVELSARALEFDGTPCLVYSVLDLTEKKDAEAEIERQREMIYHREKLGALGSLLAGVAHELNNPLSVVVSQSALLEEQAPDSNTAARSARVRAAAERCARLVRTFLAMARQRPPSRAAIDINETVSGALELLAYGLRTAGIELVRELEPNLPPVWGDPDQIGQVVTNLIVNAQQALAERPGLRRLTIASSYDAAAKMLQLSVTDNGPGVPAKIKSRIFEPFFTTKPVGVGTGIGLSVCHGVVSAHGGSIAVEDAPGGGALFVVRLPAGGGLEAAADGPAAPIAELTSAAHVLIVDDEPEVAETLAEILTSAGHRIDVVDNGAAALEKARERDYALILSDLRMPGMDGIELYRRLVKLRPDIAKRFIAVTGDTLSPSVQTFLSESGRPCLEKPFNPAEVRQMLEVYLSPGDIGQGGSSPSESAPAPGRA